MEAGREVGAGPRATRWRCAPASSQRAGVMTSWTPVWTPKCGRRTWHSSQDNSLQLRKKNSGQPAHHIREPIEGTEGPSGGASCAKGWPVTDDELT